MADTEGTRATKISGVENGALSIKVPPSNTRGIQYGAARVIDTRTDCLMASKFGTNQKIMMHGLINSRVADLIKIKLWRLLRRLLWQDPNNDHSKNWRYLSASRKSYVITSCYLTRKQMNTASKYVNQNISPRAGNMA